MLPDSLINYWMRAGRASLCLTVAPHEQGARTSGKSINTERDAGEQGNGQESKTQVQNAELQGKSQSKRPEWPPEARCRLPCDCHLSEDGLEMPQQGWGSWFAEICLLH